MPRRPLPPSRRPWRSAMRSSRSMPAEDAYGAASEDPAGHRFQYRGGSYGPCREGYIPSILEHLKIPYTASDPLTLNICLDKARTKEILAYNGLPTSRFRVVSEHNFSFNSLHYPLMVKPLYEGSSIGIRNDSLVRTRRRCANGFHGCWTIIRSRRWWKSFFPAGNSRLRLSGTDSEARVLPIVEILFDSLPQGVNPIYSYEAKWIWDQSSNPLKIFRMPGQSERRAAV